MASRKVWIVGGCLVLVIGAVAYLNGNSAPAGKDAAGSIVEVSRTHTDGATPTATADQAAATPAAGTPDAAAAAEAAKGDAGGNASAAADATNAAGGNGAVVRAMTRGTAARGATPGADRDADRASIR